MVPTGSDADGTGIPFRERLGRCYELSGRYLMGTEGTTMVHGTIEGAGRPPIDHAWVVTKEGKVFEPASNHLYAPDELPRHLQRQAGPRVPPGQGHRQTC